MILNIPKLIRWISKKPLVVVVVDGIVWIEIVIWVLGVGNTESCLTKSKFFSCGENGLGRASMSHRIDGNLSQSGFIFKLSGFSVVNDIVVWKINMNKDISRIR